MKNNLEVLIESNVCSNSHLNRAKISASDEYYTYMKNIEKELPYYKKEYYDKIIYCNCDDIYKSNFVYYLLEHFNDFKLKKLIATGLSGYKLEVTKMKNYSFKELKHRIKVNKFSNSDKVNISKLYKDEFYNRGDFRSSQCLNILKESDIVITNPPFSLFREFLNVLYQYKKKFLIVGNYTAVSYNDIFPYIQNNKIHSGMTVIKKFIYKGIKTDVNASWYTNLKSNTPKPYVELSKHYSPKEYPKLDNYNAINVNSYNDIPKDYYGTIGVPITFLHKYNPKQFVILGLTGKAFGKKYRTKKYKKPELNSSCVLKTNKGYKILFTRVLIKRK